MPTSLTAKQARFVQEYLVDGNGSAAAVRAGYGVAGARVTACRMLANTNIKRAVEARQRADAARLATEREDVLKGLLDAISTAREHQNPAAMIAGWREIGRLMGFYAPSRIEVDLPSADEGMRSRLERMTDDELRGMVAPG